MRVHQLRAEQRLPARLDEVWPYFATPANLRELTPPEMRLRITSPLEPSLEAGQIITYRLRPLPGFVTTWVTAIAEVDPGRSFVDVQLHGPYRLWVHRHRFEEARGGVLVRDVVSYALPLGPLGELAHRLDVRRRLERIFAFRAAALERRFGPG